MALPTIQDVLMFWFDELTPQQWFNSFDDVDQAIVNRFSTAHEAASKGELFEWRETPDGRLAEIIVLDQFARNLFRGDPRSFATDTLALVLAQEAIAAGDDQRIDPERLAFLYMPFMHSESLLMHEIAEKLFDRPGMEMNLKSLRSHTKVLQRFGRYPHRNAAVGRQSTADEIDFLKDGRGF
ncbi:DUF924 domain-containing protein [Alphaproteobacteria bacterium]|nr:DUF924 domain-containing protein [Alphaproteobacteria bacterium]